MQNPEFSGRGLMANCELGSSGPSAGSGRRNAGGGVVGRRDCGFGADGSGWVVQDGR